MKKQLPHAQAPFPKFKSDKAEAEYFDTHSVADVWDQLSEVKTGRLPAAVLAKIRDRHAQTSPRRNRTGNRG
jgi:hypothetical protein